MPRSRASCRARSSSMLAFSIGSSWSLAAMNCSCGGSVRDGPGQSQCARRLRSRYSRAAASLQTSTHSAPVSCAMRSGEIRSALLRESGRRHHLVERLQRHVAIDRQRCRKPERADAADRMAGDRLHLGRLQHRGFAAERVLDLAVVEAGQAAGHHQKRAAADAQRQRLGDLRRLDAMRGGSLGDGRRACFRDEDRDVGGVFGEEFPDGLSRLMAEPEIARTRRRANGRRRLSGRFRAGPAIRAGHRQRSPSCRCLRSRGPGP